MASFTCLANAFELEMEPQQYLYIGVFVCFGRVRDCSREFIFPPSIYCLDIQVGENEVKDIRIPACRVALDAFFDIL